MEESTILLEEIIEHFAEELEDFSYPNDWFLTFLYSVLRKSASKIGSIISEAIDLLQRL